MRSKHEEEDDDEEDAPIDKLDKKSMMKRISFVKKSHHNFDTYMNMLRRWADGNNSNNTEKKPDIDDLLRKLFSNEDE